MEITRTRALGSAAAVLGAGLALGLALRGQDSTAQTVPQPSPPQIATQRGYNAAEDNLRYILPAISTYFSDHATYAGMTPRGLRAKYDRTIKPSLYLMPPADQTASSYCVQTTLGGRTFRKNGPRFPIEADRRCG